MLALSHCLFLDQTMHYSSHFWYPIRTPGACKCNRAQCTCCRQWSRTQPGCAVSSVCNCSDACLTSLFCTTPSTHCPAGAPEDSVPAVLHSTGDWRLWWRRRRRWGWRRQQRRQCDPHHHGQHTRGSLAWVGFGDMHSCVDSTAMGVMLQHYQATTQTAACCRYRSNGFSSRCC